MELRLNKLLYSFPNPEMTSFVLRETMMMHLLIYGNAYSSGCLRADYRAVPAAAQ